MIAPSLAMIPTGFKDGKLYSVLPESGVGDFTVTRGSGATRVNKNGLVEDVRILSGELVTNGDFSNGSTGWIKGTGWSISGGVASCDGTQISNSNLFQVVYTSGKTYKTTISVTSINGTLNIFTGSAAQTISITSEGTYEVFYESTTVTMYIQAATSTDVTIDNVSVKEVTTDTDIPRLDYTDGGCPVLLTEPQSTNLITYSEDFSDASWIKSGASVVSGFSSPDGGTGAFKLVEDTNTGVHFLVNSVSVLSGSTNYNSIYVKPNGVSWVLFYDGANNERIYFDLQNKVIGNKTAGVLDYFITELSGGWLRIGFSSVATSTSVVFRLYLASANNVISYTGDGTSGVYIWGAQAEALSYSTSYIPTSGAIATRLADEVSGAGDATTINSTEGVLYAEIAKRQDDNDGFILISLNNEASNSDANSVTIGFNNGTNFYLRVRSGAVSAFTDTSILSNKNQFYKVALKYKSGDISVFIDGVNVASSTATFSFAVVLDSLSFDYSGSNVLPFYGKTKDLRVYNTALTDLELQELTTI